MAIEWQQNNRLASGGNEIARLHSDDLNSTSSTESGQKELGIDVSIFDHGRGRSRRTSVFG